MSADDSNTFVTLIIVKFSKICRPEERGAKVESISGNLMTGPKTFSDIMENKKSNESLSWALPHSDLNRIRLNRSTS